MELILQFKNKSQYYGVCVYVCVLTSNRETRTTCHKLYELTLLSCTIRTEDPEQELDSLTKRDRQTETEREKKKQLYFTELQLQTNLS